MLGWWLVLAHYGNGALMRLRQHTPGGESLLQMVAQIGPRRGLCRKWDLLPVRSYRGQRARLESAEIVNIFVRRSACRVLLGGAILLLKLH